MRPFFAFAASSLVLMFAACTPYTMASTARTVPRGETQRTRIFYAVPGGLESRRDSTRSADSSFAVPGMDMEWRYGIDERSDFGLRVTLWSGAVATYKRRLGDTSSTPRAATAIMVGGGLTNWGQNAHAELSVVTSGREDRAATGYGGVRFIQTAPLGKGIPQDQPTIGAFGGIKLGKGDMRVSLEIGAFYDHSALGLRSGDFIVVPAVSVHAVRMPRWLVGF